MLRTVTGSKAVKVATLRYAIEVHLQVLSPVGVRIATDAATLEQQLNGFNGGLIVQPIDGITSIYWKGDLFAISNDMNDATFDIEFPTN